MSVSVKIVEFEFKETTLANAESDLERLINNGYRIVSQSENLGSLTYTLVKNDESHNIVADQSGGTPAHKYQLVNGSVEQVMH